ELALSSLGGFLDGGGVWPQGPAGLSFSSWRHVAALGRDGYVRTTYRGGLFPLMHRATLIKVTERRFEPAGDSPVAYLRQYHRILVDERERSYDEGELDHGGRGMPFDRIRINVDQTPKIKVPEEADRIRWPKDGGIQTLSFEIGPGNGFWPFPCTGTDRAGNPIDFEIGLIFVPEDDDPKPRFDAVAGYYEAQWERTAARARPAKIRLAPSDAAVETTSFVATGFRFAVDLERALPGLSEINVRVPAVEALTGRPAETAIAYTEEFLGDGFDAAGVFAKVIAAKPLGVDFSADQAGGISCPNLSVRGFSRDFGPIGGDLAQAALGQLDLDGAFASVDATLFGVLPLREILASTALGDAAPKIKTELKPDAAAPEQAVASMTWACQTKEHGVGPLTYKPDGSGRLEVKAELARPLRDPIAAPSTVITGTLSGFSIELSGVARIKFERFRFRSETGKGTEVTVDLDRAEPIEFLGALEFLHKFTELLPPGLFGANGPRLKLRPDAVEVGFAFAVPPAAVGVFSIRNIAIDTALVLPFLTGSPTFAFAFSSREKPFGVSVILLGGGGFARVVLDPGGVRAVEAMFEFGGMFSLDIGIASGSVHSLAGIYLGLARSEAGETTAELTGYVRVGGEVSVLLLYTASIECNISLGYYPDPPMARGSATVTVSIRVAFVSKSVSFSVERRFTSGSEHLSIGKALTADDWAAYAAAFA
ncbi:hypothetical protein ACFW16_07360, partial [Inquilinus sp. NPDC058860]